VPLPSKTLLAGSVAAPIPPFVTGSVPVTPVVSGKPVAFVSVADEGMPSAGVTKVGLLANTSAPLPVSSVTAAASCAEVATKVLDARLSVLFVSVAVLLAVTTLLGVMMLERVAIGFTPAS
jgi:hypothetical protein